MTAVLVVKLSAPAQLALPSAEPASVTSVQALAKTLLPRTLGPDGRLEKMIGTAAVCTFPTPDAAAAAAIAMQNEVDGYPPIHGNKPVLRGGLCVVATEGRDAEAAKLATCLMEAAPGSELLLTRETVLALSASGKAMSRHRPTIRLEQQGRAVEVYELVWRQKIDGPGSTLV